MIKTVHPGIYCTVQDQGRVGFAKMGIPQAGTMDSYSAKQANILLNHHKHEAVVEITYGQGKFEFTSNTLIVLTGGDFSPKVNSEPIEMNRVYSIKKGAVLSFGHRNYGARVYLAVKGGIQSEIVLNSKSFYPGITQDKLSKGTLLKIHTGHMDTVQNFSKIRLNKKHFTEQELTCYAGPEFEQLSLSQKKRLFGLFSISDDNNRVGYRLNEPISNNLSSILTSAVFPGTVQLTPSGKLIVLMKDCQVTGGYPRVLQLSEYAISRLSQKVAGEAIKFKLIDANTQ